jgi:hypothetical protein
MSTATESHRWRAESVGRLQAAMADGSHHARAAFGHWYRVRVWNSIATRVIMRPFAFETEHDIRVAFVDLERRWGVRHAVLCALAALDPALHDVLAQSVLRRVFDAALQRMNLEDDPADVIGALE